MLKFIKRLLKRQKEKTPSLYRIAIGTATNAEIVSLDSLPDLPDSPIDRIRFEILDKIKGVKQDKIIIEWHITGLIMPDTEDDIFLK